MTGMPEHSPWHSEISRLALFISIPQLIVSPVIVGIAHVIAPNNIFFEAREILDFLVISFPLTLSVAIILILIQKRNFNLFTLVFAVIGAALLSNLLHIALGEALSVDILQSYNEVSKTHVGSGGNYIVILWILKIFSIYWQSFGPFIFIQSCCIGIYAADKYLNLKKKETKK